MCESNTNFNLVVDDDYEPPKVGLENCPSEFFDEKDFEKWVENNPSVPINYYMGMTSFSKEEMIKSFQQ